MSRFTTRIFAQGASGNIFVILGTARSLMRQIDIGHAEIEEFTKRVKTAESYRNALAIVREWFPVDAGEDYEEPCA